MLQKYLHRSLSLITHIKGKEEYATQSKAAKNYILNFSATWCGPCKVMGPVLQKK